MRVVPLLTLLLLTSTVTALGDAPADASLTVRTDPRAKMAQSPSQSRAPQDHPNVPAQSAAPSSAQATTMIQGTVTIQGTTVVKGKLAIEGTIDTQGAGTPSQVTTVTGKTTIQGTVTNDGTINVQGTGSTAVGTTGAMTTTVAGTITVQGVTTIKGKITSVAEGGAPPQTASTQTTTVEGAITLQGAITIEPSSPPPDFKVFRYESDRGVTRPVLFATGNLEMLPTVPLGQTASQGPHIKLSLRTSADKSCLQGEWSLLNQAHYDITCTPTPPPKPKLFPTTFTAPIRDKSGGCTQGSLTVEFGAMNARFGHPNSALAFDISVYCQGVNPDCKYNRRSSAPYLRISGNFKGMTLIPNSIQGFAGYFVTCDSNSSLEAVDQPGDSPRAVPTSD